MQAPEKTTEKPAAPRAPGESGWAAALTTAELVELLLVLASAGGGLRRADSLPGADFAGLAEDICYTAGALKRHLRERLAAA